MGSTSNIYTLVRLYGKKVHRTMIPFDEFCGYIKKYAQHYVTEQPELAKYTQAPQEPLLEEITNLASNNKIILKEEDGKRIIVITTYFKENVNARYKAMAESPSTPYPIPTDLPKDFPQELITTGDAADILYELFDGKPHSENVIFSLVFKREIAPVLLPQGVSPEFLLQASIAKLRLLMHHSEQHDYFMQKLLSSNGGREISVKNFFNLFISNEEETIIKLKEAGDCYYFWNQLFLFIRHDYEKIKDRSPEDVSLLQAVYIAEIAVAYYKNRSQVDLQRETALRNLELAFTKQPYYFDQGAISKFADSRGVPLLGQYTEEDLNEYIKRVTTSTQDNKLPQLLTFKTPDGTRYYILREKTLPLFTSLCTEARKKIHDTLTKEWFGVLQRFSSVPEMKDMSAFNNRLSEAVKKEMPVLYALLNSSFLPALYYEAVEEHDSIIDKFNFINEGQLLPYNELLMLSQHSILTDARILLPVWYTIPVVSFILALFFGKKVRMPKKSANTQKQQGKNRSSKQKKSASGDTATMLYEDPKAHSSTPTGGKKDEFKRAAADIEKMIVPQDSSLDSELTSYLNEWNHLLDKNAKKNLTEDVNSLIRDYLRKILRTSTPSSFTFDRVQELSVTLVKTPALQKIGDQDNLQVYIQLYILRLIKKA